MVKTITLKSNCSTLGKTIKHVEEQLKDCVTSEPVELLISVDEFDNLLKTMEVLFDRASVERINQARRDWKPYSYLD